MGEVSPAKQCSKRWEKRGRLRLGLDMEIQVQLFQRDVLTRNMQLAIEQFLTAVFFICYGSKKDCED
ncbi:hypothetical protein DNTS_021984 [Danionella cerebrum]|uniref:Uncharacterized protein n=1 Tax=Danionella cerebrum TaxID=2873325 RepID=A0A553QG25_9TELE|nr:hypothetical protein DNTS_021984 [Danionella translucida]